jgi:hypothetical protein
VWGTNDGVGVAWVGEADGAVDGAAFDGGAVDDLVVFYAVELE